MHGRCHFRHLKNEAIQQTASESAGPRRTCRDLQSEVRQLRKEIQELTKEVRDWQSKELEKDEEVNQILKLMEDPGAKRKKKRKVKRNRTPEPEKTSEIMEDPEIMEMMIPMPLRSDREEESEEESVDSSEEESDEEMEEN